MFSMRYVVLGTLAAGGIAVAGYYGYKYYRTGRTSLFEQDVHQKKDETAVQNQEIVSSAAEKELPQKHVREFNEGRGVQEKKKKSQAENEVRHLPRRAKCENMREKHIMEAEATLSQKPIVREQPAESDDDEETTLVPTPRTVHLQHVRNAEELEMTFEALADYYVNQERSDEELEEAKRELMWAWPIVLKYKNRLVSQTSPSAMDAGGFSDDGTDMLDSSSPPSMVVTEDDSYGEDEMEEWGFMSPDDEEEDDAGYENGSEESS